MLFSYDVYCCLIIWIINIVFFISLLPQIALNYKLKSAKGLSNFFILGSLVGQASYIGYAFYANLPFVYKIMNVLYCLLLLIIIFQRIYYSNKTTQIKLIRIYLGGFISLSLLLFAFSGNQTIGCFLGWLPIGTGLIKKVPQIFKIHFQKSIKGFSLGFICLNIFAYVFEMCAAIILKLPLQVILNDAKNIILFSIFLIQFFIFEQV
ncbi:PQ-loop repeat-containing protein [Candidatus Dependentiae bacterium]